MKLNRLFFVSAFFVLFGFSLPAISHSSNHQAYGSNTWVTNEMHVIKSQASNLDDNVLRLGLTAYLHARKFGYTSKPVLTIIDYSKPSYDRRMWVLDLQHNRALFNTWVAHGKNSGGVNATSFSNRPGSLKSSIGVFQTASTYSGKNGYSLRLRGLEQGYNDSAYSRAIVVHGAAYANAGRVGRSWGCPAVNTKIAGPIINTIKEKSVVFAYYPDRKWLSRSHFLSA